ncbi:hypothetical protein ANN_01113 [Periplaneta americana]|uniref:Uncharacterized protein n=1 Tax=Periplaneta americana TaxID=6978 RepID=A0ABQ8TSN9_PERAM|nr:hypothetical protein ANN_01113 [Periplaneta americana]
MADLSQGGNESLGSLKVICKFESMYFRLTFHNYSCGNGGGGSGGGDDDDDDDDGDDGEDDEGDNYYGP